MKFKVLWTLDASKGLAEFWVSSRLKIALTEAANSLDQALAENPHELGESREGSRRIAFYSPLGINFDVRVDKKTVYVIDVWQY